MANHSHEGGCLCGAIRYRITGTPKFQSMCHCRSCRRASGAPVVAFVGVPDDQFEELKGSRAIFESSPGVKRGFCRTCGSSLTFAGESWPGEIHIFTATLDDPEAFPPTVHTYCQDRLPWIDPDDGLPRLERFGASQQS